MSSDRYCTSCLREGGSCCDEVAEGLHASHVSREANAMVAQIDALRAENEGLRKALRRIETYVPPGDVSDAVRLYVNAVQAAAAIGERK